MQCFENLAFDGYYFNKKKPEILENLGIDGYCFTKQSKNKNKKCNIEKAKCMK